MFIKYQHVRNAVLGGVAVVIAIVGYNYTVRQGAEDVHNSSTAVISHEPQPPRTQSVAHALQEQHAQSQGTPQANREPAYVDSTNSLVASSLAQSPPATTTTQDVQTSLPDDDADVAPRFDPAEQYRVAIKMAMAQADSSGKGKDVLGPRSPWKLNLYDDDLDGRWDRGKLDLNRDDTDDENWTFKQGRWEKDGGARVWDGSQWSDPARPTREYGEDPKLARYRTAMQIALSKADPSGKGKDVLGSRSPWKLNLYDDDKDGQWDRAKLDTNRDEVDDEKWNFKHGRWEKDGGATIWADDRWVKQ
ncbi:MAG: hypothetical protein KDA60_04880 [Planctomycetales bacterium]|nr:hypothetical protein [Planctomycetales bacterium]